MRPEVNVFSEGTHASEQSPPENRSPELIEAALKLSHVGIWVADLVKDELIWDDIMRSLHAVGPDFEPKILSALQFFKEGYHRDTAIKSISAAVSEGKPFDDELIFINGNNEERWVRAIGNPVFENNICIRLEGIFQDIHDQKLVRLKVLESEKKYRNLADKLRNVLCVNDLNGVYTYVSPSMKTQFGYEPEEMVGENVYSFMHPDDIPKLIEAAEALLTLNIEPEEIEFRFRHKSGKYLWSKALTTIIQQDENDMFVQSETYVIQEKKELEEKLASSEQSFRGSFEQAITGMAKVSTAGKFIKVNHRLCQMIGYTVEELLEITFADITYPEDLSKDMSLFEQVLTGKRRGYEIDKRYIHKNGDIVYVTLAVSVVLDEFQKPIHFVSQVTDITAQKNAERERVNLERRFREIFNSTYQFIGFLDTDGTFLEVNDTALDFAGVSSDNVVGKKFWEAYWWPISDKMKKKLEYTIAEVAKGKTIQYEMMIRDRFKKSIMVDFRMKPVYGSNGEVSSLLCEGHIIQDMVDARNALQKTVGKLKRRENELETLIQITEEQNKRLMNFAHIVTHNLRSHSANLNMLVSFTEEEEDTDQKEIYFGHLRDATDRLTETIANLNEVVEISTTVIEKLKALPLRETVESALPNIKSLIKISGADIINMVPETIMVKVVPAYLESIILNFLTNSIKYASPDRKPRIQIEAREMNDNDVEIIFSDNGIGIDLTTNGNKIFGMYKTFHGNVDARGIGLFISKNQIEAMGGAISVESTPDFGTTFTVVLKSQSGSLGI